MCVFAILQIGLVWGRIWEFVKTTLNNSISVQVPETALLQGPQGKLWKNCPCSGELESALFWEPMQCFCEDVWFAVPKAVLAGAVR